MISQNYHFQVQKFSQKYLPKCFLQFFIDANKHPKYSIDTLQFPKPSFPGSTFFLEKKIFQRVFLKDTTWSTDKYLKYSSKYFYDFPKLPFSGSKISFQVSLAVLYRCKQTSQILHRQSSIPKILIFRFNIFSPRKNPTFHKKENLPSRELSPILDEYHAEHR